MKRMNMVAAAWAALLLVMGLTVSSCREKSEAPGDGKEETGPQVEPQGGIKRVVAKSGWDIYVAGVYRYGPCIILNDDGSMDAWFAAPGGDYTEGSILLYSGEQSAFQLMDVEGRTAGQMFEAPQDFRGFTICVPTYGSDGTEDVTISIYAWKGSYESSVAADPLNAKTFRKFNDNDWLTIYPSPEAEEDNTLLSPAGKYLVVLSDPTETTGCWIYSGKAGSVAGQAFKGGKEVPGALMSKIIFAGDGTSARFWDQISYQHSTDGGRNWSPESMTLKPTFGGRDAFSCCDPGLARWGGWYYLGYTSTENEGGLDNDLYVARSKGPDGPWEKWNGNGWGGNPQPIIEFTGSPSYWGCGEPCFVVMDDKVFLYYSWNTSGEPTTRVATFPADDENWPAKLSLKGVAIDKKGLTASDHCDVKYVDAAKRFLAVHTTSRMSKSAYIMAWESEDGLNFKRIGGVQGTLNPSGLHNCGLSGDERGHMDLDRQQYIGYAYGLDESGASRWGQWSTYLQPLTIVLK